MPATNGMADSCVFFPIALGEKGAEVDAFEYEKAIWVFRKLNSCGATSASKLFIADERSKWDAGMSWVGPTFSHWTLCY
ncbi:hypothetical protein RRF57_008020 [Xylaria bambusicola]|uniref:Uncharacterized protein n=1 Tax=Xylaria bambusicola TaxID=326684 RepID=A0AAN7UUK9_9PEZI